MSGQVRRATAGTLCAALLAALVCAGCGGCPSGSRVIGDNKGTITCIDRAGHKTVV